MMCKIEDGKVENLGEVVFGIVLKCMGLNIKVIIDGINVRILLIN